MVPDAMPSVSPAQSRHTPWLLAFMVGLLLGWLVVGWWLWPIQWTNSSPADLSPEHQRTFVELVAIEYAQTHDIGRVRELLTDWNQDTLIYLVNAMEAEAKDPGRQQRLAALREILALPQVDISLLDTILRQKPIVMSALAAISLLVVAILLALLPSWKRQRLERALVRAQAQAMAQAQTAASREAQAETAGAADADTMATAQTQTPAQARAAAADSQPSPDGSSPDGQARPTTQTPATADEQASQPAAVQPNAQAPATPGQALSPDASQAQPAAPPAVAASADQANAPPPAVTAPPMSPEEAEQSLVGNLSETMQEILTNVFDDEDNEARYEVLLKGTQEINIQKLVSTCHQVADQLLRQNSAMTKAIGHKEELVR